MRGSKSWNELNVLFEFEELTAIWLNSAIYHWMCQKLQLSNAHSSPHPLSSSLIPPSMGFLSSLSPFWVPHSFPRPHCSSFIISQSSSIYSFTCWILPSFHHPLWSSHVPSCTGFLKHTPPTGFLLPHSFSHIQVSTHFFTCWLGLSPIPSHAEFLTHSLAHRVPQFFTPRVGCLALSPHQRGSSLIHLSQRMQMYFQWRSDDFRAPANNLFGPLAKELRRLLLPGGPLQPPPPPPAVAGPAGPSLRHCVFQLYNYIKQSAVVFVFLVVEMDRSFFSNPGTVIIEPWSLWLCMDAGPRDTPRKNTYTHDLITRRGRIQYTAGSLDAEESNACGLITQRGRIRCMTGSLPRQISRCKTPEQHTWKFAHLYQTKVWVKLLGLMLTASPPHRVCPTTFEQISSVDKIIHYLDASTCKPENNNNDNNDWPPCYAVGCSTYESI